MYYDVNNTDDVNPLIMNYWCKSTEATDDVNNNK